ncbi:MULTISPECIES: hypothetical protein [Streptomyces]|uniref:Integral membrane protein n=1 Tax=Streptomyces caniscabiei TaxID=2746961 RepID=A0ABU4MMQ5_9ACTN|nr:MULTISPECIES: hypothetical protein [Streptomyces]MDX2940772.1 hypothetical protein [Streptomyces caniscabiei]MDX2952758.1 hypothetical protein [Streptomyces caniscabiei]MDX2982593.1 hypothetical protein [Streptomyces caniscabiei]MDX3008769.1 hypothetical protein [Streptomyces caniscabiei]MDX3038436.1 hypothetical protein [Streptomyces caniscabiei]
MNARDVGTVLASDVWRAVRPRGRYQRLLWWCGTALLLSGAVHGLVAVVDGAPWWGPVSWRKPVAFGVSFGLLVWSVVWIMRQLPARWWVRVPAGLIVAVGVCEVGLITAQRWRGVASHFNQATDTDAAIWSMIGTLILPLILGLAWLFVVALIRFDGSGASRVAVLAGLAAVLVAGYIGGDMAAIGEAAFDETGHVPREILFGAAGSAKLAHATGLHGVQLLAVLAILSESGRPRPRRAASVLAVAALGYAAVLGAVTATAYAGRAPYDPTLPYGVLLLAGVLTTGTAAAVILARASSARSAADPEPAAGNPSPAGRTGS